MSRNQCETGAWYALQVRPRYEFIVADFLGIKGYESFVPLQRGVNRHKKRQSIDRPLFQGYVFCRFNREVCAPIVTTPGIVRIVGIGPVPQPLETAEVIALQQIAGTTVSCVPIPYLEIGRRVRIISGPLQNLEGILLECRPKSRLVVSVSLLQRSVAVDLEGCATVPLNDKHRECRAARA